MAAGRPKKPKKILELTKTVRGKDIANRTDDVPSTIDKGSVIEVPESIKSEYTKKQWYAVTTQLINLGILAVNDVPTLEQAFGHLEEYHHTLDSIHKIRESNDGPITDGKLVETLAKLNSMLSRSSREYNAILYRFGVTPVERTKIQYKDDKAEMNPVEALLEGL